MIVGKEDLELSLRLSSFFPDQKSSLHLNLMPSSIYSSSPSPFSTNKINKTSWNDYSPCRVETRCFLKGIDVAEEEEGRGGVSSSSSPNSSTISSVSGGNKRSERELATEDAADQRACIISTDEEEDADNSRNKKLRLSKHQSAILEETFKHHNTLNPKQKMGLAKRLGLRPRQVEVWFQNRRARTKLKQTEVDCEFLKRCCENLREENRRLQKEVQELRALKLSPHNLYMQMTPPTTLTMCPSCERSRVATTQQLLDSPTTSAHPPRPIYNFNPCPPPHSPIPQSHCTPFHALRS